MSMKADYICMKFNLSNANLISTFKKLNSRMCDKMICWKLDNQTKIVNQSYKLSKS